MGVDVGITDHMSIALRSSTPSSDTVTSSPVAVTAAFCQACQLDSHSAHKMG